MTAASDNKFPKLIITEGSAPSSPASGDQKLYIDSSSHHLSRKNSSGTVTDLETNQAAGSPSAHACRAFRDTSDQSVGNNTFTAVQWNNETFDTDTMHDSVTNNTRITVPSISGVTTGLWRFTTHGYTSATALRADCKLKKNGTTDLDIFVGMTGSSGAFPFFGTWLAVLSATDYMEVYVRTTSGSFSVVGTDATSLPQFEAEFLGKVT